MRKSIYTIIGIVYAFCSIAQIPDNKTVSVPESGTKLHQAVLSIKFDKGYTYTPAGGTLTAQIVNPTVGDIAYQNAIDPATYAINTALPVKALNEQIEVNGSLQYSVNFEVPKGAGGLQPSLGLNYSNSFTDGFTGVGFNITGLSSIDRVDKTIYHDGKISTIAGNLNDAYALDGKRLLHNTQINTVAYGSDGSVYGTELEEFSKIVAVGSSGTSQGPQSFLVYTKSGLIMEYGNTSDSRVIHSGTTVLSWKLNKVTDRFNNSITYNYYLHDDERPITQISYNGNTAQIKFKYKQRPNVSTYVHGGVEFTRNILLDNIEIANNNTLFKKYEFVYNLDNYSQLQKTTEFSSSGQQMNPTVFSWTKQTDALTHSTPSINYNDEGFFYGDFNGDGITDYVSVEIKASYTTSDKFSLFIGSPNGVMIKKVDKYLKAGFKDFKTGDFNGDGKTDLFMSSSNSEDRNTYYKSLGEDFTEVSTWVTQLTLTHLKLPVDYDGDGKLELLFFYPEHNSPTTGPAQYELYTADGTLIHNHSFTLDEFELDEIPDNTLKFAPNRIFDFNGDGKTDIIQLTDIGFNIFEFKPKLTKTITGSNFNIQNRVHFGDFNGDGSSDILKTSQAINPVWSVLYYTKDGIIEKVINGMPNFNLYEIHNQFFCSDFNGDGKMDIITWGKGTNINNLYYDRFFVALNKGNGVEYSVTEYTSSVLFYLDGKFCFGDYNGDGRDQLLFRKGGLSSLYSFATGTPGNLMQTIINSHGAKTSVNYLPMTNTAVYTKGSTAAYPLIDLGASIQLVSSVVTDNGTATPTTTTTYTYSGAKAHLQGKGFLGFSKLTAVNGASGVSSETNVDFDVTYFYPKVSSVINKKGSAQLLTDSYIWDRQIVSGKRIFPYIKSTNSYNNLTGQNTNTEYFYYPASTYGNLEKIKTWYYGGSHTKETVFTYNNELTASYLIGRPTTIDETYIRDGFTTTKKITRTYKTTSNAVETETYNPGDASSWTLTREYDTRGNIKKETKSATGIASQITEFTFDTSTGVNLEKVKNTNLGLETNYTYYAATGLLKVETDPFGNKFTYVYDNSDQLYTVTPTTGVTKTITRSYNISGGPSLARFYVQESGTDNTVVKTWFDKTGKDIRNETKGFSGTMIKTDKVYLSSGLLQKFSEPTTGTPSNWNTYGYYTADNRLNTITPKFGPSETYSYTNAVTTKTINGRQYKTTLNNDNSVLSNEDPAGIISYTYWPDGSLKSTQTPEGISTSMTYDKNGNRLTIADPSAGTITDTWYGTGQQKTSTNANGKLTTWYYQPDGLVDYVVTDGLTTNYSYNSKGRVSTITSPDGVTRSYFYNIKGQDSLITESVSGVSNSVAFEYDAYGRLYKKKFNGTDYEQYDYQNGYLYKISFNGSTVWQATTIDEYSRVRAANIGATAATWGYNTTTNLLSQIKGTSVQQYDYDFNGSTRNLTTRTNGLKTETFGYDTGNLDRLISVTGTSAQTIGYDATIKGNITSKTDVGNYTYDPTRKYAVQTITNGLNISTTPQSVVYNAFNKVKTITEGTKTADFVYNADRQRIRMTLKISGTTTKTRYYFGGSCEREVVGSTTTQYIWIGGDAYTAVAVAKKTGTGSWTVYNIFRDHLGTITHLKTGSTITEYSFDAWGRRRNALNWSYDLTGQPALFADRGFTAHELLADFNLYNMNGRLYDPVVGRFLSPDPFIQDPSFSQSYNRYSYALNNPLKYTDPTGESWKSFWNKIGNWLTRNNIKFQVGYNSTFGPGFSFGDNPMYYPGYENKIVDGQRNISNQIAGFSGMGANTGSPIFGNGDVINQQFVGESLSSGGGLGWEAYVGTAGDIAEEMYFSKTYGTWMGKNFKMYKQTWGGNGVTGGKNKFGKTTSNAIKWGGHALGAWNAYSTQRDYAAGKMGTGWMLAEQGTNTVSTFGGIYGAAWGVGWEMGRAITTLDAYQEFKFNFWYNRMENAIGPPSPINEGAWYNFFNNY